MYEYTTEELNEVIEKFFTSTEPLKLRELPAKDKKKYLVHIPIIQAFERNKKYTEVEVNMILKSIYPTDHCIIRRNLVDYKFLGRENMSATYWVIEK
ncbi:DUF2087 domain-containing protein [Acholeplasma hippikon]|uniref:Uncharacterized protein conserved in bacteria (DUF2087) n=1 Tax=Acholeplasma hippikon TaxID=264636 RepID=A0A449BJY4_9MOLU|nr:DUF2087 domain-containing protein [Acholeplasma hippikon]VEU82703.1 Uncharacterized protein conserved in bacteria (DUF2087) [Acholeplasma hippikon]